MSEICEVCGETPCLATHTDTVNGWAMEAAHWERGYERTLARADRYQAEFAACKALLIAEQKRAERAEAERAEWKARAEQWALREAALVEAGIRREAEWLNEQQELTRRASETQAALEVLLEAKNPDSLERP